MPKVMIEMEMPKSCQECDFLNVTARYITCVANKGQRIYFRSNKKDNLCPLQEVKESESMKNNKNCANCIYYKVDEINTVDKSNPRAFCYALPSTTLIRHRVIPCIYYKEKE